MLLNTHVNWGLHLLQIIISPIKFLFLFQFPVEKLLSGEYLNWYNQTSAQKEDNSHFDACLNNMMTCFLKCLDSRALTSSYNKNVTVQG